MRYVLWLYHITLIIHANNSVIITAGFTHWLSVMSTSTLSAPVLTSLANSWRAALMARCVLVRPPLNGTVKPFSIAFTLSVIIHQHNCCHEEKFFINYIDLDWIKNYFSILKFISVNVIAYIIRKSYKKSHNICFNNC